MDDIIKEEDDKGCDVFAFVGPPQGEASEPANHGDLSGTVKYLRKLRDLTQEDLARRAGVTRTHVWQIESGARTQMRMPTLWKYANALGVDPGHLITGHDDRAEPGAEESLRIAMRAATRLTDKQIDEFLAMIRAVEALNH